MHCNSVKELLSDYIDGLLEESQQAAIAMHLESCPACQAEYTRLLATVELMNGMQITQAPAQLAKRIIGGLRQEKLYPPRRSIRRRLVNGVAAAAAVFILAAVVTSQGSIWGSSQPEGPLYRRTRSIIRAQTDYLDASLSYVVVPPLPDSSGDNQMIIQLYVTK